MKKEEQSQPAGIAGAFGELKKIYYKGFTIRKNIIPELEAGCTYRVFEGAGFGGLLFQSGNIEKIEAFVKDYHLLARAVVECKETSRRMLVWEYVSGPKTGTILNSVPFKLFRTISQK